MQLSQWSQTSGRRTAPATPRGLVACHARAVVDRPAARQPAHQELDNAAFMLDNPEFQAYRQATSRLPQAERLLMDLESTLKRMDAVADAPKESAVDAQQREARAQARAMRRAQRQQSAPAPTEQQQHAEALLDSALEEATKAKQRLEALFHVAPSPARPATDSAASTLQPAPRRASPSAASPIEPVKAAAAAQATGPLDFARVGQTSLLPAGPSLPALTFGPKDASSRRNRQHARGQTRAITKNGTAAGAGDSMTVFMKQAGTSNLLDGAMEKDLALMVKDYLFLQRTSKQLAATLQREPSSDELAAVVQMDAEAYSTRVNLAQHAKTMLMQSNYRLVISIVKKYQNRGMSIQDLVSEGMQGLLRGVEKYDPTKGFRFSTYAHWWIRQAVTRSLSDQSRTVRLPSHIVEALAKISAAREQLRSELMRDPTPAEVEARTGIPKEKATEWMAMSVQPASLESAVLDDDNAPEMKDMLVDERMTSDEVLGEVMVGRDLEQVLKGLSEREAGVIKLRFGLLGEREMTLEEIGEKFHVTRERVRQIEAKAIRKLKSRAVDLEAIFKAYTEATAGEWAGRSSRGTKKT